jgi:tRNA G18 (ribose-2'-O)-methylase SpoU
VSTPPTLQPIGVHHRRVQQILAVQHNTAPNPRRLIFAEGLWAHRLLIEHDVHIDTFYWCPEAAYGDEARARAGELAARADDAFEISARTAARVSERDRPDGLMSLAYLPQWSEEEVRLPDDALVMVADGVEIPGNLGTLLRTLDGVAADCLLLTNRRTRLTHPKVLRASQGAVLTMPVLDVETVEQAVAWLRRHRFEILLADTDDAVNYRQVSYGDRRTALVVGAEKYGLHRDWHTAGDRRVFLPMLGYADSLNVSVSAAVMLYEARAQKSGW